MQINIHFTVVEIVGIVLSLCNLLVFALVGCFKIAYDQTSKQDLLRPLLKRAWQVASTVQLTNLAVLVIYGVFKKILS